MKTHLETGCSRRRYSAGHITTNTSLVTCLACRKIISAKGLRPREHFQETPTLVATSKHEWSHVMGFTCPCCGTEIEHSKGDGHRVAHCKCWKRGYYVVQLIPNVIVVKGPSPSYKSTWINDTKAGLEAHGYKTLHVRAFSASEVLKHAETTTSRYTFIEVIGGGSVTIEFRTWMGLHDLMQGLSGDADDYKCGIERGRGLIPRIEGEHA